MMSSDKTPWLDPWAFNVGSMLHSMVPNCVKKVQHLRLCRPAVAKSFATLVLCLSLCYPTSLWKNSLVVCARKWDITEELQTAFKEVKCYLCSPKPDCSDFLDHLNSVCLIGEMFAMWPPDPQCIPSDFGLSIPCEVWYTIGSFLQPNDQKRRSMCSTVMMHAFWRASRLYGVQIECFDKLAWFLDK